MRAAPAHGHAAGAAVEFPWDEAMAAGLGLLRLAPETFWRMTPREFAHATRPFVRRAGEAPSRDALEALVARFPDTR